MQKNPRIRTVALSAVLSCLCSAWIRAYFGAEAGSASVFAACLMLFLAVSCCKPTGKEAALCVLLGGFFSGMRVLGYSYDTIDSYGLILKNTSTLVSAVLAFAGLGLVSACAILLLVRLMDSASSACARTGEGDQRERRSLFIVSFCLIFAGSLPYLMLYWPGLNIYDTRDQILQFFGYPSYIGDGSALSDHHPVFLTVVYGLFMKLGLAIGNVNAAQALYSLMSMAAIAACYAFSLCSLYDAGLKKRPLMYMAAFIALYPVLALYAFNMCKDVSVEPFVLLYLVQVLTLLRTKGEAIRRRRFAAGLFVVMLLMMLTRKPSMYALLFACVFMIAALPGVRVRVGAVLLSSILVFQLGYSSLLLPALGVIPGETREMLSIPFQMTARYLTTYGDDISEQEMEAISRVLDVEYARENYDPRLSDPVKDTSNPQMNAEDMKAYLGAFVSMGMRHPGVYLDAWLNMIYGYFYPSDSNTIVCLTLNSPGQGGLDLVQNPELDEERLEWHNFIYFVLRRLPGVRCLFYVDSVTWLFLFIFGYIILRKGIYSAVPMMFFAGTLGICMLSPKSGEIRYLMPILYALPVLLGEALIRDKKKEENA